MNKTINKKYNIEVLDETGTKVLASHKNVELDESSMFFYCMRLKQRFGFRPVGVRWQEVGSKDWHRVT